LKLLDTNEKEVVAGSLRRFISTCQSLKLLDTNEKEVVAGRVVVAGRMHFWRIMEIKKKKKERLELKTATL
jgi:hypothetical protein